MGWILIVLGHSPILFECLVKNGERKVCRWQNDIGCSALQIFPSPPEFYRCRAEFAVWHDGGETSYVMYETNAAGKKERVKVFSFPIAHQLINDMMPVVLEVAAEHEVLRRKLIQVWCHLLYCSFSRSDSMQSVHFKLLTLSA
jgi:tRNA (uracil-5-)-methyltransferase